MFRIPKIIIYLSVCLFFESLLFSHSVYSGEKSATHRSLESVAFILQKHDASIQKVYEKYLAKENAELGQTVFQLSIDRSGRVSEVKVTINGKSDRLLAKELLSIIKGINFGESDEDEQLVDYPMSFILPSW